MRYSLGLTTAAAVIALAGVSAPASAQSAAQDPTVASLTSAYDQVVSFGQSMAQKGVFLNLDFRENVGALVAGGIKTGVAPVDQISGSAVFDLQTIMGLTGASIHIGFDQRGGAGGPQGLGGPGGIAGTSVLMQSDAESLRFGLAELYWEQGFDNDRLDFKLGRTQPTTDFLFSDIACAFVSSILCAQPGSFYLSNNSSPYGYAQWGGRVNFQVTPQSYIRFGMYNEDPSQTGFNYSGTNWNTEHSVGVFSILQIGYKTSFANARLPSDYYIGMYNDSSGFTQSNGTTAYGRKSYYAWAEQALWRPDRATKQSLTAFASVELYDRGAPFYGQYTAGIWDRAPFGTARPGDALGVMASLYQHNPGIAAGGGYYRATTDQYALEADYDFAIVRGLTVAPYVQYVVNPDQGNPYAPNSAVKNDVVVGVQFDLNLGAMFQMPEFVAH
jgi:porin